MPETNKQVMNVTQGIADAQNTHTPNVPPQNGGQLNQAELNPNASRGRGFRNAAHLYRGGQQWRGNWSGSGINRMGSSSTETKMTEFISAIMKAADNSSSESSSSGRGRGQTHRPYKRQRAGNQLARNMRRLAKKEANQENGTADKDAAGNKKEDAVRKDANEIEKKTPEASTVGQGKSDDEMQQG